MALASLPRPTRRGQLILLTILLPCRDEAATITSCVGTAHGFLDRRRIEGEVLVVDNGSTDGSARLAVTAGARVVEAVDPGYGNALNVGIASARGTITIMADADGSYDLGRLDAMLDCLNAGAEVVIGDRFAGGIKPGAMPWLHRRIGNPALSWLGRRLFGFRVRDVHCGLRGFRTSAVRDLGLRTSGMEWATEMIVVAAAMGLRIEQVPVTLSPDGRDRAPHLRTWSDGWRHLRLMLLMSPRWLFHYPGMLALTIGLLGTATLSVGPVEVGRFGLDIATLLYAAALAMIGHSLLWFGAISGRFAGRLGLAIDAGRPRGPERAHGLERGLAVGAGLIVVGLAFAAASFVRWGVADFDAVDPRTTVRIVTPAVLGLVLGAQTIFSSLLLSVMELPTRATDAP